MTYKQAMKPKEGWAHAKGESLIAGAATILARYHCLNPEAIFKWAKKHCPDLWEKLRDKGEELLPPDTRILTCVLNSCPLPDEPEYAYGKDKE